MEYEEFRAAEGLEETLKVNVLSSMSLCQGLLPVLAETAQTCGVVTHLTLVGSLVHFFGAHRELHAVPESRGVLEPLSDRNAANMKARYPLSKLMEHLCFQEFVAANAAADVVVNIVNPGWCGTELFRNKHQPLGELLCFAVLGRTAEEGSRTLVHGICAGQESHGKYLSECQVKRQSSYVNSDAGASDGTADLEGGAGSAGQLSGQIMFVDSYEARFWSKGRVIPVQIEQAVPEIQQVYVPH